MSFGNHRARLRTGVQAKVNDDSRVNHPKRCQCGVNKGGNYNLLLSEDSVPSLKREDASNAASGGEQACTGLGKPVISQKAGLGKCLRIILYLESLPSFITGVQVTDTHPVFP